LAETFFALAHASRERWGAYAAELETETGIDLHYRAGATLVVAQSDAEEEHLRATVRYLRTLDEPAKLVKAPRELEPELASNAQLGLFSPNDGQVDPRVLCRALHASLTRAGGSVHEHAAVDDIIVEKGRAVGVRVNGDDVRADHVLLASGAWCDFPSVRGAIPAMRPVKGQLLSFQAEPGRVKHIVWGQGVYIVPRADGHIIIGATMEDAGFDTATDEATIAEQKAKAARVLPFLGALDVTDRWAGLRPASADGLPMLGPSEIGNLTLAMGHFRNGILLTPVTVQLVMDFLLSGDIPPPMVPFLPERLSGRSSAPMPDQIQV